jgi:hypothetical protein
MVLSFGYRFGMCRSSDVLDNDCTDSFIRVLKPCLKNLELLVLKGHLVLEQELVGLIEDQVPHARHVREAGLKFSQKVKVAQAVTSVSVDVLERSSAAFCALEELNKIRNNLAHNAEPKDLEKSINVFCSKVLRANGGDLRGKSAAERLKLALILVYSDLRVLRISAAG